MQKGDIIWVDDSKTKAKWEPNFEGKFIMGCDMHYIPNWWQRILIRLSLIKDKSSKAIFVKLPKDDDNKN
jgi:hypothetical protein